MCSEEGGYPLNIKSLLNDVSVTVDILRKGCSVLHEAKKCSDLPLVIAAASEIVLLGLRVWGWYCYTPNFWFKQIMFSAVSSTCVDGQLQNTTWLKLMNCCHELFRKVSCWCVLQNYPVRSPILPQLIESQGLAFVTDCTARMLRCQCRSGRVLIFEFCC